MGAVKQFTPLEDGTMCEFLTTSQAGEKLSQPAWWVRRRLNELQEQGVEVPRFAGSRVVTPALLARLRREAKEEPTAVAG
jgi:hypothetical protein